MLLLLLYIFHNATRDISRAFNASRGVISGLCEPAKGEGEVYIGYSICDRLKAELTCWFLLILE